MKWYQDNIFTTGVEDRNYYYDPDRFCSPSFRLSLISSLEKGKVHDYTKEFEDLFVLFQPILEEKTKSLHMVETAGLNPRRRKSIKGTDWHPFEHMCSVIPDDDAHWIGFDFKSNISAKSGDDIGPTKFFFEVMGTRKLDINIPVEDFENNKIDIDQLKKCLLAIPSFSGLAGYGVCITQDILMGAISDGYQLIPIAQKYPSLDLCQNDRRQWWPEQDEDTTDHWILGVNWLTMVCEPYLSALGGLSKITKGLNSQITWEASEDAVIFQLGERPITGQKDVDDDLLSLYFELGERLKPIGEGCPSLKSTHSPFGVADTITGEEHLKLNTMWARRFYDQQWFKEFSK
jgi:hypothetical protein